MTDKVINFEDIKSQNLCNEIIILNFLQALEQITQEINLAFHYTKMDDLKLEKTIPAVKKDIGNDALFVIKELCRIHGNNLKNLAAFIDEYTDEPGEDKRAELQSIIDELPEKYKDNSIILKVAEKNQEIIEKIIERGTM